jgi:hypothetical protein
MSDEEGEMELVQSIFSHFEYTYATHRQRVQSISTSKHPRASASRKTWSKSSGGSGGRSWVAGHWSRSVFVVVGSIRGSSYHSSYPNTASVPLSRTLGEVRASVDPISQAL